MIITICCTAVCVVVCKSNYFTKLICVLLLNVGGVVVSRSILAILAQEFPKRFKFQPATNKSWLPPALLKLRQWVSDFIVEHERSSRLNSTLTRELKDMIV